MLRSYLADDTDDDDSDDDSDRLSPDRNDNHMSTYYTGEDYDDDEDDDDDNNDGQFDDDEFGVHDGSQLHTDSLAYTESSPNHVGTWSESHSSSVTGVEAVAPSVSMHAPAAAPVLHRRRDSVTTLTNARSS
jgi:hypothetical protein